MSLNDTHSISHTKWNCKYAPKYTRSVDTIDPFKG